MTQAPLLDTRESLDTIKGWFFPSDVALFRWFLERQRTLGITGGVVELGAYLGKSTVVIGDYVEDSEPFVVVDLFESDAPDTDNSREMSASYSTLTRQAFEANYLRFHPTLPAVHTAPSSAVTEHVEPGSVRFLHVDASHLYEHVAIDVDSARELLLPDGVVAFDDYRSEHTPGVAAAVWEAVLSKGMRPICVSQSKLYATWGDPSAVQTELFDWLQQHERAFGEYQQVAGHRLIRCKITAAPQPASPPRPAAPAPRPPVAKRQPPPPPTGVRRLARDWAPPKVLELARSVRRRRG